MRIVCSSGQLRVRWLCPHLPRVAFAVGSRCLMSIVPLVLSMLTWCCAWLLCLAVCGHCRAPRWRMAVQSLAPCNLPVSFISRTHRHPHCRASVGLCCRVHLPAHGRPQRGEECCRCAWWCARRMPRWLRGSTKTATTLMAWNCRITMGTGGRWSRTDRSAKLGMSEWRRLGCRLLQKKRSAPNMSEYRHMLCTLGVSVKHCTSDRYSSGRCLGSIHEAQPNARRTVAPSLIPHWM
ncbi:hypothetical protein TCDM_09064 [Trypanosoma cruzi Dm28c]|uniref:Uncharacterized protein n=1 Tax=Trypanosoma cruzi Dm28c TaxID=1416333 RepID=V5D6X0_TRYCR|nr:hypothetical protein TCDM_09064 [Trypanosoma cruzi Dm28c]